MWTYDQSTGTLARNGKFIARGYSGANIGKNNPDLEAKVATGPIPRGNWRIGDTLSGEPEGGPYKSNPCGPYCLRLTAVGHKAHGRSAFLIHGDSAKRPGQASKGCIILPRNVRELIWNSGDRALVVVE